MQDRLNNEFFRLQGRTMEEKVKDILAEITSGAEAKFKDCTGVEAAFIVQETNRIMDLHREVLGNQIKKINNIIGEFGDNPEVCLSIINETLNGGKDIIF